MLYDDESLSTPPPSPLHSCTSGKTIFYINFVNNVKNANNYVLLLY